MIRIDGTLPCGCHEERAAAGLPCVQSLAAAREATSARLVVSAILSPGRVLVYVRGRLAGVLCVEPRDGEAVAERLCGGAAERVEAPDGSVALFETPEPPEYRRPYQCPECKWTIARPDLFEDECPHNRRPG